MQLHGSFPMWEYPALARAVESHAVFTELTVHDVVWWRPVWPILTLVAEHTDRVLVGPDVTHPYLVHPAVTAQNVAALDELSRSRAVLGVGRGSFLEPLGIRREQSIGRVKGMVEEVQQLLAGTHPAAALNWKAPRPRVPVFLGTFGERMVAAAAGGWCDEVRPPGTWDTRYLEHLRSRVPAGVELGCDVWVSLDPDRERARDLARAQLARFLPQMKAITDFYGVDPAAPVSDDVLDLFFAAGDRADVERGLQRLLEARPATVIFSGRLGPDPARAIAWLAEMTQ
ncbi:MAG TPA: LLM class flavin-dependent oxidoreductase [Candidatus Dormibacteraeota bacterium]